MANRYAIGMRMKMGFGEADHALVNLLRQWDVQVHRRRQTWNTSGWRIRGKSAIIGGPAGTREQVFSCGRWVTLRAERGARRFPFERWGKTLAKDSVSRRNTGAIDLAFRARQSESDLRVAMADAKAAVEHLSPLKWSGQRALYRSSDGGRPLGTCKRTRMPAEGLGRIGIAFAPSNLAANLSDRDAKEGGLFRSDNAGQSWNGFRLTSASGGAGGTLESSAWTPRMRTPFYVPNTTNLQSRDGGKTCLQLSKARQGATTITNCGLIP